MGTGRDFESEDAFGRGWWLASQAGYESDPAALEALAGDGLALGAFFAAQHAQSGSEREGGGFAFAARRLEALAAKVPAGSNLNPGSNMEEWNFVAAVNAAFEFAHPELRLADVVREAILAAAALPSDHAFVLLSKAGRDPDREGGENFERMLSSFVTEAVSLKDGLAAGPGADRRAAPSL